MMQKYTLNYYHNLVIIAVKIIKHIIFYNQHLHNNIDVRITNFIPSFR